VLFALCAALIDYGIYQEIFINRMPVGHTHGYIDAMFRCVELVVDALNRIAACLLADRFVGCGIA
jgi:hypothetical protein